MRVSQFAVAATSVLAQAVMPSAAFSLPKAAIVAAVATAQAQDVLSSSVIGPYQGKIYPDDPDSGQMFGGAGGAIAVHGHTAAIGARRDDEEATYSGAIYIFAYNGTAWVQHQKLKAENPIQGAQLGHTLDMYEDNLFIAGAAFDRTGNTVHGSAIIFAKNENGIWEQQAKLIAEDGGNGDYFGNGISISGNTAMVGAYSHDGPRADGGTYTNSGAVYVYVNDGNGNWAYTQKIVPSDVDSYQAFGQSVALRGTKAIFSSSQCKNDDNVKTGCAYFYEYDGSSWEERQQIFASDGASDDVFGEEVKMHGDRFITGAKWKDDDCDDGVSDCGSVYIFNYNGTAWVQEAKIPSNTLMNEDIGNTVNQDLGNTVDIYGDKAVVQQTNADHCYDHVHAFCGIVYVFQNVGNGNWEQQETLIASDADYLDRFGSSVAIYEDTLFVGAFTDDANGYTDSGSVYVWGTGGGASSSGGDTDSAGPWEIQYIGLSTDFSNSSSPNEISSNFFIGKDRESEVLLLDKNCESNITDIVISTTKDVTPNSTTFNLLSVHHDLDKSSIANSSIWNGTSSELEVCQVVRLVLPASETGGNGKMTVAEDTRQIKIGFDMTADFNITAGLASATVFNETATTDVSSFVRAYKCSADDTDNEDTSVLAPNDELSVCVISEAPNEVNVKELVSMTAIQEDANLAIVDNGGPFLNSLTSIISISDGVMVTTRLPSNSFQFADGNSVTIQGQVEMELADGSTRKLRVLAEAGIEGDEEASYELEIGLQEGDAVADDGAFAMGNPATAAVALDKALAFAIALAFVFAS